MNNHIPMESAIFTPLVVFILAVLSLCRTASIPPFICGAGACNLFGSDDQYCSAGPESRCVPCRDVQHTCFEMTMPFNCTTFCLDRYSTQLKEKFSRELKEKFSRELKAKPCEQLPNITNGFHNESKVSKPGDVIESQCQTGFHLVGSSIIKCLPYGQWSVTLPICKETICSLPVITHGAIVKNVPYTIYRPGMKVPYICENGYRAVAAEATCLSSGTMKSLECIEEKQNVITSDICIPVWTYILIGILVITICAFSAFCLWQNRQRCKRADDEDGHSCNKYAQNENERLVKEQEKALLIRQNVPLSDMDIKENVLETKNENEETKSLYARYVPPEIYESISENATQEENQKPTSKHDNEESKHTKVDDQKSDTSSADTKNQGAVPLDQKAGTLNLSVNITTKTETSSSTVIIGDPDKKESERPKKKNGFHSTYAGNPTEATIDTETDMFENVMETERKELENDSDDENNSETEVTKTMKQPTEESDKDKKHHKMALKNNDVEHNDSSDKDRVGVKRKGSEEQDALDNKGGGIRGKLEKIDERLNVHPEDQSRSGMIALNGATLHTGDLKRSSDTKKSTSCSQPEDTSDKVELMLTNNTIKKSDLGVCEG